MLESRTAWMLFRQVEIKKRDLKLGLRELE